MKPSKSSGLRLFELKFQSKVSRRVNSDNCACCPDSKEAQIPMTCFGSKESTQGFKLFDDFGLEGIVRHEKHNEAKIRRLYKRAWKHIKVAMLRAKSEFRKSAEARSWLASSLSDFTTLLSFGLFASALPFSIDTKASDELRVAIFGALSNATSEVLEHRGKSFTASEAKPERIANFVVRNALVPAALHHAVTMATDMILNDAKGVERHASMEFTNIYCKVIPHIHHFFPFLHT